MRSWAGGDLKTREPESPNKEGSRNPGEKQDKPSKPSKLDKLG